MKRHLCKIALVLVLSACTTTQTNQQTNNTQSHACSDTQNLCTTSQGKEEPSALKKAAAGIAKPVIVLTVFAVALPVLIVMAPFICAHAGEGAIC